MAIYGLDQNYYCAYTPIPVQVTPQMPAWNNMRALIRVHNSGFQTIALMYAISGIYYIDLSTWIQVHMSKLNDQTSYSIGATAQPVNERTELIDISFMEFDLNSQDGDFVSQDVQKTFVQCALYKGVYENNYNKHIKMWRGYPYSFHRMIEESTLYTIPNSVTKPSYYDYIIEYEDRVCKGTYLKWLNEYGGYYYWFFPSGRDEVTESENIFDVNRNVFDNDKRSNYDSVGFDAEESFTVRDRVKSEYWHMFRSLTWSVEVYVLKDDWIDDFSAGTTTLTPDYWIKVRQKDFSFERTVFKRQMTEIEVELEYPKPYTQKLI